MPLKQKLGAVKRSLLGRLKNTLAPASVSKTLKKLNLGSSVRHIRIEAYRLGSGPQKALFLAGIHGNEVGTVKLCCQLINHLAKNKTSVKSLTLFFIPCLNPDGYMEALAQPDYQNGGRVGRLNAHQVDLNRNFPTKNFEMMSVWNHGKSYHEKTKVFCGHKGGSEPETRALLQLIHKEKISAIFSFHNVAEDLVSARDPLSMELATDYAAHTGFYNMLHEEWRKLDQTGTLKEWCEENHVSFLEIEGSVRATRWGSDWGRQKKALLAALAKLQSANYNADI